MNKKTQKTEEEKKADRIESGRRYRERHPDRVKESNKKNYDKRKINETNDQRKKN